MTFVPKFTPDEHGVVRREKFCGTVSRSLNPLAPFVNNFANPIRGKVALIINNELRRVSEIAEKSAVGGANAWRA
jgi:hypothetical protein